MDGREVPGPLDIGHVKARQFREAVVRWRGRQGQPAPEVEFYHPWPKHEHLSRGQLRWFLYWRTLWEQGEVRKTSLSYMMIHIFELLSLEYLQKPEEAVERLIQFYSEFHNIQPKLDVTLVRWIGDLYLKMDDPDNAIYWYTKGTAGDLYEKLSWYRYGDRDIPLALLQKVASLQKSQFYRERLPQIDEQIEEMVHSAFRAFTRIEGEHPLDRYARYSEEPVIYLFSNTPVHEKLYLDGFRRYDYSGGFVHWVKNCLRHAENLLRRAEGKAPLKHEDDVSAYFAEWESVYPQKVSEKKRKTKAGEEAAVPLLARDLPETPVEVDLSRVRELTAETDWLVDMMAEEGGELLVRHQERSPKPRGVAREATAEVTAEVTGDVLGNGPTDGSADSSLELSPPPVPSVKEDLIQSLFASSEAEEVEDFLDALPSGEQAFLRHVALSGHTGRRALAEWLKGRRMFLDATVAAINEAAVDAGLEPVLIDEDEEIGLEEETAAQVRAWAQKEES